MYLVTEKYEGLDFVTRFDCRVKAETLARKINAKGGEATMSKMSYD